MLPVWPPTPCRQSIEWIHTDSPPSSPIPRSFCDGLTLLPAAVSVTLAQTPEPGCVAYYPRETAPPHGTSTHGVPGLHKRVQLFVSVPVSQMPAEKFLGQEISPSTHTGKCVHWSPRPLAYTLDAGSYGSSRGVRATPRVSRLKGSLRAGAVSHAGTLRASRYTATHVTQPYTALQGLVNRCRGRTGRFTLASATRRARARRGWVAAVRTHLSLPSIQIGLSPCSCLQCTHRAAKRAPRLLYWHLPWGATAVPDAACEHSLMTNGQVISVESTRVHCEWLPSRVARNAAPRTHLGRHSPPAQSPRLSAAHQGSSSGWLRLGGLLR